MKPEYNDYIINTGVSRFDCGPYEAAATKDEAIARAKELCLEYPCVEVVYMPVDNDDINDIIWSNYN